MQVAEHVSQWSPEVQMLLEASRSVILEEVPDALERVLTGWNLIAYYGPRYFCFLAGQRAAVRLGFEKGGLLPDPEGVLEAHHLKSVRYVTIRRPEDVQREAVRELIRAAFLRQLR